MEKKKVLLAGLQKWKWSNRFAALNLSNYYSGCHGETLLKHLKSAHFSRTSFCSNSRLIILLLNQMSASKTFIFDSSDLNQFHISALRPRLNMVGYSFKKLGSPVDGVTVGSIRSALAKREEICLVCVLSWLLSTETHTFRRCVYLHQG